MVREMKFLKGIESVGRCEWGACLRELRKKKNLTQGDIYRMTGLERNYISRFEAGQIRDPKIRTVIRLALALDMTVEEFVSYCEKRRPRRK